MAGTPATNESTKTRPARARIRGTKTASNGKLAEAGTRPAIRAAIPATMNGERMTRAPRPKARHRLLLALSPADSVRPGQPQATRRAAHVRPRTTRNRASQPKSTHANVGRQRRLVGNDTPHRGLVHPFGLGWRAIAQIACHLERAGDDEAIDAHIDVSADAPCQLESPLGAFEIGPDRSGCHHPERPHHDVAIDRGFGAQLGPDGGADQISAYRAGDGESVGGEPHRPGHLPPDRHRRCHCLHIACDLARDDYLFGGECDQIAFDRPLHHHPGPDGVEIFGDGVPLRDDHDLGGGGLRGEGRAGTDEDEDARDSGAERRSR